MGHPHTLANHHGSANVSAADAWGVMTSEGAQDRAKESRRSRLLETIKKEVVEDHLIPPRLSMPPAGREDTLHKNNVKSSQVKSGKAKARHSKTKLDYYTPPPPTQPPNSTQPSPKQKKRNQKNPDPTKEKYLQEVPSPADDKPPSTFRLTSLFIPIYTLPRLPSQIYIPPHHNISHRGGYAHQLKPSNAGG